ncbi:gp74 [Corynebacterium phage P1201]|uniref:Gp74 n=1 Tax=Corynebacterium phage P1201 TaxID=384848 RepID=A7IYE1_9CAUD|nr:gp74 [Corynebacterium phage P1201]ABF57524.1 gp74 [Corynebacterium phage P1201]
MSIAGSFRLQYISLNTKTTSRTISSKWPRMSWRRRATDTELTKALEILCWLTMKRRKRTSLIAWSITLRSIRGPVAGTTSSGSPLERELSLVARH